MPDLWVFCVSETASWRTSLHDRDRTIYPRELFFARSDGGAHVEFGDGRFVSMSLPAGDDYELRLRLSRLRQGVMDTPGARILADVLLALPDRLRASSESELRPLATDLAAIMSACLRGEVEATDPPPHVHAARMKEHVVAVIRDNIGSALLDVSRICRLAGVSRTTLYRIFEGEGGVASFVRDMRLKCVMDDFADPNCAELPIARIAERRGLHNASSFSRVFRRAYGCSPSAARAAASSRAGDIGGLGSLPR